MILKTFLLAQNRSRCCEATAKLTMKGVRGNLVIRIRQYEADVHCQTSMSRRPEIDDCESLLLTMSTSKKIQVFGRKGTPGVEVVLPISLDGGMLTLGSI